MGKRNYISRTQVIMKTFAAALFAAVVSATSYTATGTADGTEVKSSKVTATTAVDNTVSLLCTLRETSKSVCSYCEVQYVDATNYKAIWAAYTPVKAVTLSGAATTPITSLGELGSADGGAYTMANTKWDSAVSVVKDEKSSTWVINSIKGSSKTTLDCDSTYTDTTDNTTTREDAVKKGMA